MNKEEFKALYDAYNAPAFDEKAKNAWDTSINKWNNILKKCFQDKDGPELEDWVKSEEKDKEKDYIPYFLETGEKFFGHAKPGTMQGCMIYKKAKDDKIYDGYDKTDKDSIEDEKLKEHYNTNIKPLLKNIVGAKTLKDVYDVEKSDLYANFKAKQMLRKITILMSLTENNQYKNEFMWIFIEKSVDRLAQILEVDIKENDTFLGINNKVYKRAKDWTGTDEAKRDKGYYYKLYNFLWDLSINDVVVKPEM